MQEKSRMQQLMTNSIIPHIHFAFRRPLTIETLAVDQSSGHVGWHWPERNEMTI
jgi:hypothetical protein